MNKALVVIDTQNDFIAGPLGSEAAVNAVKHIVDEIKKFDGDIYATIDTHDPDYLSTQEGKNLPVEHCIKMTEGWLIHKDILTALGSKKYRSIQKDTFGSMKLASLLKDKKYDDITLVGICTDVCVISNALILKSNLPNAKIRVISRCCAGTDADAHRAALKVMKNCHIEVIRGKKEKDE